MKKAPAVSASPKGRPVRQVTRQLLEAAAAAYAGRLQEIGELAIADGECKKGDVLDLGTLQWFPGPKS